MRFKTLRYPMPSEIDELRAEVERLREINAELRQMIAQMVEAQAEACSK